MDIKIEVSSNINLIIIPENHLDASNSKDAKESLLKSLGSCKKAVLELQNVNFVDNAGLGVMLSCLRKMNEAGGDLKIAGMKKPVRALFELVRMHKVFDIYNSREEAVAAYGK